MKSYFALLLTLVFVGTLTRAEDFSFAPVVPGAESDDWSPFPPNRKQWFLSEVRERELRALFPKTDDPETNAAIRDKNLILYTEVEVPLAHQVWNGVSSGLHSPIYDLSGGEDSLGRGSGYEFPWADPAGTHEVAIGEILEFRGFLLPKDSQGDLLPIVYWQAPQEEPPQVGQVTKKKIEWVYPRGTIFLECLCRDLGTGQFACFELRQRKREEDYWSVNVFRPYVYRESLERRLRELGYEVEAEQVAKPKVVPAVLRSPHPDEQEINEQGFVQELPAWRSIVVEDLLWKKIFQTSLGERWSDEVVAPSGGINPQNYKAFMDVDSMSCNRCHRAANRSVKKFHVQRNWYGNIRGSDRILSFHIFDPECISYNGANKKIEYRKELVWWGLLEDYDKQKHPPQFYYQLRE